MNSAVVLLAEDHLDTREGYELYLRESGLTVQAAADGHEVLEHVRSTVPDILIVDMGLPVLDGWETTRQLRESWSAEALPIIALTGYATASDRRRAAALGCNAFLPKPCAPQDLLREIGRTLSTTWSGRIRERVLTQPNRAVQAQLLSETHRLAARVTASVTEMRQRRLELHGALADLKSLSARLSPPTTPDRG